MIKLAFSLAIGGSLALFSMLYGIASLDGYHTTPSQLHVLHEVNFFGQSHLARLKLEATEGNGSTVRLFFRKPTFSAVELYISDLAGNRIRTLIRRFLPKGAYEISWYGETDLPEPISPGVYVAVLAAEGESRAVKFVWVE